MWLSEIIFFCAVLKLCAFEEPPIFKIEAEQLTELFFENLRADPMILAHTTKNGSLTNFSKKLIQTRIDNFVSLFSDSQSHLLSREKRSLQSSIKLDNELNNIRFLNFLEIPSNFSDDVQLFNQQSTQWCASILQNGNNFSIFKYKNKNFSLVFSNIIEYSTNLAVYSGKISTIFALGTSQNVEIFEFFNNSQEYKMEKIQELDLAAAKHVQIWHNLGTQFLSVTSAVKNDENVNSEVRIYKWQGKHFDLIQKIEAKNVQKTLVFEIDGKQFLVLIKNDKELDMNPGQEKTYSDIYKQDLDTLNFELYQKLYTNNCHIIKFFRSFLNGAKQNFLIVAMNSQGVTGHPITVIYKFVENYFIPFQSLEINALEWQWIQGEFGNIALLAFTKNGPKGFLYDDWYFSETQILRDSLNTKMLSYEPNFVHTFQFKEKDVLVISCSNCSETTKILTLNFTQNNKLKDLHLDLLKWCETSIKEVEDRTQNDFLVGEALRGDLNEDFSQEQQEIHQISAALSRSSTILFEIEEKTNDNQNLNTTEFLKPIFAGNIVFNEEVKVASLKTEAINDIKIQNILEHTINIKNGFKMQENALEFEIIAIEDDITPKTINDIEKAEFLTVFDDIKLHNIQILGTTIFENNLLIRKSLNDIEITHKNLFLNNVDQEFDILNINNITVKHLTSGFLNNLNLRDLDGLPKQDTTKILQLDKLKVKDIKIGGLLNRISIPILNQQCLKRFGDQTLDKTYYFNSLEVENLNLNKKLGGKKIPEDFVPINGGDFTVNEDIRFLKGLNVNKLEVLTSLNNITVNDEGNLDILTKNTSKIQIISAKKIFENLILTNPIKLRNKIRNRQMEERNPIKLESKNFDIDRDVTVEGDVDVKKFLKATDVFESLERKSIGEVLKKGVKLIDEKVPVKLHFLNALFLDEVFVEKVSNFVPENWLLKHSENVQYINGTKRFVTESLNLCGSVAVETLNGIKTTSFEKSTFKINEDQDIFGNFKFEFLAAENGTSANEIIFGSNSWKNVITTDINKISNDSTTIFGNIKANSILVNNSTEIRGLFNNEQITEILKNVATKDKKFKIFGEKQFKELYINDLTYLENSCVKKMLDIITKSTLALHNNLFLKNIQAKHVVFENTINNITKKDFEEIMDFKNNKTLVIENDVVFNSLEVDGKVFIKNNEINGVNLTRIEKDTVKIDEDHRFQDVIIESSITFQNNLEVKGNIENLDLDNIFNPNYDNFVQNKVFLKDVEIFGYAHMDGLVNNVTNLTEFCRISTPSIRESRLFTINGDVMFVRGRGISKVGNVDISDLRQSVWISDQETILNGNLHVDDAAFEHMLTVNGYVNNENLTHFSENYLSKSRDQNIEAKLTFDNQVIFEKNVSTPKLRLHGQINSISLDEFVRVVLLDGVDQVFEDGVYFEETQVRGLAKNNFLVNNLNLDSDVMRYDQENIVIGHKTFRNLEVHFLNKGGKQIKIQNADLSSFVENVVLKNGTFWIKGEAVFNKAVFEKDISVKDLVNSKTFTKDTVLLSNVPQTIDGKIVFDVRDSTIKFKSLKTKGLVNGLDIWDMVKNQAKNTDIVTIDSEMEFQNNIFTSNLIFENLYNNLNMSELIQNVTKLEALENYVENYENLLNMSLKIENSLKNQAQIFKHYKEVLHFTDTYESFGLKNIEEYFIILTFAFVNGTHFYRSFEWVPHVQEFVYRGEFIESYAQPYFMDQIKIYDQDYLYIEHYTGEVPVQNLQGQTPFTGRLLQLSNFSNMVTTAIFPTNGTSSLISLSLSGMNHECLAFVESDRLSVNILCDESGHQSFYLFDTIRLEGVFKISAVTTAKSTYLFAIIKPSPASSDSHVVILEKTSESQSFVLVQAIFEAGKPIAFAQSVINGNILLAVTYGPRDAGAVDLGGVSIRKLDLKSKNFLPWQYIPLTTPLDVNFVSSSSFNDIEKDEPVLLISTNDVNSPLFGARYEGLAGFKSDFQGKGLPTGLKLRVVNGHVFVLALSPGTQEVTLLKSVYKGRH